MRVAPRWLGLGAVVAVATISFVACGGDDGGTDGGPPDAQVIPDASPPDAGRSCTGQARACGSFGMLACPPVPGCNVTATPVCFTLPTDCSLHNGNPTVCAETYGCYYNVFLGCKPTYRICTIPDGMECQDVAGCGSGYVCEGEATACVDLDLEMCSDNPGCFVYPP